MSAGGVSSIPKNSACHSGTYFKDEDHARQNPEKRPNGSMLETPSRNEPFQNRLQDLTGGIYDLLDVLLVDSVELHHGPE